MLLKCPFCEEVLDLNGEEAIKHLAEHLRILRENSAEVAVEDDPQGGCENLSRRPAGERAWRKTDFSKNEGPESEDEIFPPEDGGHQSEK